MYYKDSGKWHTFYYKMEKDFVKVIEERKALRGGVVTNTEFIVSSLPVEIFSGELIKNTCEKITEEAWHKAKKQVAAFLKQLQ